MASRYLQRVLIRNDSKMYKEQFRRRGVPYIKHMVTQELKYPSEEQNQDIETTAHIWKQGDRFYKLAQFQYGDPTYWWVIAWYNLAPTEAHVEFGDTIYIPLNLEAFLEAVDI